MNKLDTPEIKKICIETIGKPCDIKTKRNFIRRLKNCIKRIYPHVDSLIITSQLIKYDYLINPSGMTFNLYSGYWEDSYGIGFSTYAKKYLENDGGYYRSSLQSYKITKSSGDGW